MQVHTLTNTQIKSLRLHMFNASTATSKAIAINALIMYYNSVHANACIMQKLTIAANVEQLEVAMQRVRNSKHYCVDTYAKAIKHLTTTNTMLQAASDILCA